MKLPSSPQAEWSVIQCCLEGGTDIAIEVLGSVTQDDLTQEDCQLCLAVIKSLVDSNKKIDQVEFYQEWKRKNLVDVPKEVVVPTNPIASAHNYPSYIEEIRDTAARRRVIIQCQNALTQAQDARKPVSEIVSALETEMGSVRIIEENNVKTSRDCVLAMTDDLERRFNLGGELSGVPTGFYDFDKMTSGLQYGEQCIIAARPSAGKTAMALNIVEAACFEKNIPTLFVTLEMSPQSLFRRLLASVHRIPLQKLKTGQVMEYASRCNQFGERVAKLPLWVVDGVTRGLDTSALSFIIRRMARRHGIKLVVVDYLQKVIAVRKQEKRTYEVAEASGVLKGLAVSTGAAFLTLAQLNRESEKDKGRMPRLADLADSGQIERDADCVAMIHRVPTDNDPTAHTTVLIVGKQRDGETGQIHLWFEGQYCKFFNQAPPTQDDVPPPEYEAGAIQ